MKIYTRIVFDADGVVEEEESYEYEGPVSLAGSKKGSNAIPETSEEIALAQIAREEYDRYQQEFRGLEDKFIADVRATDDDYSRAEGNAVSQVRQAQGQYQSQVNRMDPSSGATQSAQLGLGIGGASAAASAQSGAAIGVQNRQSSGLLSAMQIGRGQAANAVHGFGNIASNAASDAMGAAQDDYNNSKSTGNAAFSAAGMGLSAYNRS